MFILFLALLVGFLGFVLWRRHKWIAARKKKDYYDEYQCFTFMCLVFAVIFFIASFLVTGIEYGAQLSDMENLKKFDRLETIYQQKANELTKQFSKYLYEMYPKYERDIFQKITPEKVDIYLVKYPELQASKTIVALTERINQLQTDRYQQRIAKEQTLKDMRFRARNPWIWYWWIPNP